MEPVIIGIIYVLACLLVGLVGSRRSMGFFAAFFFSLIFSPIVVILILQLTRTPERNRRDRDRHSSPAS
jgi:predicted MFS family arabinose efflux permease